MSSFLDVNVVGEPQDVQPLASDLARVAGGEAGAREWMAADEDVGQPELAAERAYLVLEQFAQRLDQRHVHAPGQTTHVVV
jgi:hypothetical protein